MKFLQLLGRAMLFILPLFLLILIAIYGVNVPFWDEWSIPGEFLVLDHHDFASYFSQSNESRLIVPKLIFLAVSKFVGWQPKHYMILGWVLMVAIFALTYRLCYRRPSGARNQDTISLLFLGLSCAILFSPAQYENWLWGIQWVIFVPLLCALIAFDLQRRTASFGLRLAATILLNLVGMFSFSNGMILWIVSFPFWQEALGIFSGRRLTKREIIRWLAWSAVYVLSAVAFIRIYFTDYKSVFPEPPLAYALKNPWSVVKYFAAWCGGPLHANGVMHLIMGFGLLLAIGFASTCLVKKMRQQSQTANFGYLESLYPSFLIMVYALGSGAMTALGRASLGFELAYSSRYLYHSGTLWVGFFAALNAHRLAFSKQDAAAGKLTRILVPTLLTLGLLIGRTWNHFYKQFETLNLAWRESLLNVRMVNVAPTSPVVAKICPWVKLPALVSRLREKHLYDPSVYGDWLTDAISHPQVASGGQYRVLARTISEVVFAGWTILPQSDQPADSVLICRRSPTGRLEPFGMIAVGSRNKEAMLDSPLPSRARIGFMSSIPGPGAKDAEAFDLFALDESKRVLYPLTKKP